MALGVGVGAFNGLSTVSTYILNDFNCSSVEISWIGIAPILPSFFGTWMVNRLLKNNKNYKKMIFICILGLAVTYGISALTLYTNRLWLIIIG